MIGLQHIGKHGKPILVNLCRYCYEVSTRTEPLIDGEVIVEPDDNICEWCGRVEGATCTH